MIASPKLILATICAGIVMIGLTLAMMSTFPQQAELSEGYRSPIIAFEFARTEADIAFLAGDRQSSIDNREAMRAGHRWDMVFPFAYAGFLFLLLLHFQRQGHAMLVPLVVTALIVPLDINENLVLLGIVEAVQWGSLTPKLFSTLYIATWLKWGAIGISTGVLAFCYFKNRQWILGASAGAYVVLACLALIRNSPPMLVESMAAILSLFFLLAFIQQLVMLFRNRRNVKAT